MKSSRDPDRDQGANRENCNERAEHQRNQTPLGGERGDARRGGTSGAGHSPQTVRRVKPRR